MYILVEKRLKYIDDVRAVIWVHSPWNLHMSIRTIPPGQQNTNIGMCKVIFSFFFYLILFIIIQLIILFFLFFYENKVFFSTTQFAFYFQQQKYKQEKKFHSFSLLFILVSAKKKIRKSKSYFFCRFWGFFRPLFIN